MAKSTKLRYIDARLAIVNQRSLKLNLMMILKNQSKVQVALNIILGQDY